MLPRVAIIYPTYNGPDSHEDITRCFHTLEKMNYPFDRVEIICVENPSSHGASWPFIEKEWMPKAGTSFPKMTIVKHEKDLGYSGANNTGLHVAIEHGCDYIFLLNQDADVHPDFLIKAVERAEADKTIMLVQSFVALGQDKNKVNTIGNHITFLGHGYAFGNGWTNEQAQTYLNEERKQNPDLEIPFASGAALLVRVEMAKKIGLFDLPFYMYHEDVDASFNARMHGYKVVIEPSSIIYHYYAFSRSIKKFYWMERNRLLVQLSYFKLPTLLLMLIPGMVVECASLLFAFKGRWHKEKIRSLLFYLYPSTWVWVMKRRKRIQSERLISDRTFLKWMSSTIEFQSSGHEGEGAEGIKNDAEGFIMKRIANPGITLVWKCLYALIWW